MFNHCQYIYDTTPLILNISRTNKILKIMLQSSPTYNEGSALNILVIPNKPSPRLRTSTDKNILIAEHNVFTSALTRSDTTTKVRIFCSPVLKYPHRRRKS